MDILKTIKDISDVVRKAGNIELYGQILDLQKETMNLIEENSNLRKRIAAFEDYRDINEKLIVRDNKYYLPKDDKMDGPFCTACWDSDQKLIRLHLTSPFEGVDMCICPICSTSAKPTQTV